MNDTRTGVHIFDTVGFCDMLEKALEREPLKSTSTNLKEHVKEHNEEGWKIVAAAQKKEIERMRTMISGLYRVCDRVNEEYGELKVCSDNNRVSILDDPVKGSMFWTSEKRVEGGWETGIVGGLNYSEQQGTFSVNT